jgi:hypothetical protein
MWVDICVLSDLPPLTEETAVQGVLFFLFYVNILTRYLGKEVMNSLNSESPRPLQTRSPTATISGLQRRKPPSLPRVDSGKRNQLAAPSHDPPSHDFRQTFPPLNPDVVDLDPGRLSEAARVLQLEVGALRRVLSSRTLSIRGEDSEIPLMPAVIKPPSTSPFPFLCYFTRRPHWLCAMY